MDQIGVSNGKLCAATKKLFEFGLSQIQRKGAEKGP